MEKMIKIVLILALVFLGVIVYLGIKNKHAILSGGRPGLEKTELKGPGEVRPEDKLTSEESRRIDEALKDISARKRTASNEELRALEEMSRILAASKEKGRILSAEEVSGILYSVGEEQELPLESLLEEPPAPEEFPMPEEFMFDADELPIESRPKRPMIGSDEPLVEFMPEGPPMEERIEILEP